VCRNKLAFNYSNHFYKNLLPIVRRQMNPGLDYDAEIDAITRGHIAESTRSNYERRIRRLTEWVSRKYPDLIIDGKIDLNQFSLRIFQEFLIDLPPVKRTKKSPGFQTLNAYRAAVHHAYREADIVSPINAERIKMHFRGLKKRHQQEKESGVRDIKEGKDPLPFELYFWLAEQFIREGQCFALAYMVLSWNLMSRTNNISKIKVSHLSWKDDALGIYFAIEKGDQTGDALPKDARNLYANSSHPQICPILALALYFAFDRDFDGDDGSLFPGGFQNARFGKIMKRILCSNDGLRICSSYGYNPDDFGSHSLRKGAGTFATSGSTIGASIVSLHQNFRG
jgi:hypothetical protein